MTALLEYIMMTALLEYLDLLQIQVAEKSPALPSYNVLVFYYSLLFSLYSLHSTHIKEQCMIYTVYCIFITFCFQTYTVSYINYKATSIRPLLNVIILFHACG